MPARPSGFPRNLTSWGMNTVLTGPPGSHSCAAGSIADRRNTLPLAFNAPLGDYSSLEAEQKSRLNLHFRSARQSPSNGVISNITRMKSSKSIVTIMRRGRHNTESLIYNLTAWQLISRNAGGELRCNLLLLM